jgi:predicted permease
MTKLLRRFRYWLHHRQMEAELAEEMEYHRTMLASEGIARHAMGNATLAREDARAVWIWPWLESFWQDAAYALRAMRREPGFTLTALVALGCAIGINTSLFTIFNAVALKPWPVHEPSRVVRLNRFTREGGGDFGIAEYRYFAQRARAFSGLIAMRNGEQVKLEDRPQKLTYVSGNYFRALGVDMERGRGFLDAEDAPGPPAAVAVISHDLWENRFGADPEIVGRPIRLDDIPFTVIGVTPADFTGTNPLRNDIWATLGAKKLLRPNDPSVDAWLTSPGYCCTPIAGRLAPGIARRKAEAELEILADQFRLSNGMKAQRARIVLGGTSWMDGERKKSQAVAGLLTLFIAITLVLLLACANVGNLLLARAAARRQEMAVRLSLGGSRFRLIRQLLVESMLLALGAACLGSTLALLVPSAILRQIAPDEVFHAGPDLRVLAYTIALSLLSCLAFGLAPALHGTRGGISAALNAGVGAAGAFRARIPLRSLLLSVQVAIGVVLLANAALLVRGIQRAQTLNPGYDIDRVSVLSIDLPASQYSGPRTQELTRDLEAQLGRASDLPAWGLALNPPLSAATYRTSFRLAERPASPTLLIYTNEISRGYIDAAGMHLLAGRDFAAEDAARDVALINEAAAKRWWAGENPLGRTILVNNTQRQIVGVVSDTYANDLSSIEAIIYTPITGHWGAPFVVLRDHGAASRDRVSALVKQLEPRAEIRSEPLSVAFHRRLQPSIYASELAGLLGLLALGIASVGSFGVFGYMVDQRTREIGVRMALGAQPSQIVGLVLRSSATALACGLAFGLAGAAGASAILAHALPGVHPADLLAYSGVVFMLAGAIALASAVPARRATRVDPVRALRWE